MTLRFDNADAQDTLSISSLPKLLVYFLLSVLLLSIGFLYANI